jgi:Flp pilus assembly protein TadG
MSCRGTLVRNERGSTLALMAVCLFAMLGLAALAIDLGQLRDARAEAQRAADAAALAGASIFSESPTNPNAYLIARDRALDYAARNTIRGKALDTTGQTWVKAKASPYTVWTATTKQVTLNVIPDSQLVRVFVARAGLSTWFGGNLGVPWGHVRVRAAAHSSVGAETVNCLKPFFIPDMWYEADKTTQDNNPNNGVLDGAKSGKDGGEQWWYQPDITVGGKKDYYARYDPSITNPPVPQTGFGSGFRNNSLYPNDVGLPLMLKPQTGNAQREGNWYYTLDGPAPTLRENINSSCLEAAVGEVAKLASGGKTGQAWQGVQDLVDADPNAVWDNTNHTVTNSKDGSNWASNKRTILVGLFDPIYIKTTESDPKKAKNDKIEAGATYSNFARVWIESVDKNNSNITARFVGFAPGGTGGPTPGTIIKKLQLIE